MFTNPFSIKTDGTTTVTATELNNCGTSVERAVDGSLGGTYSPSTIVKFNSAGVGTDTVLSCGAASTVTLAGTNVLSGSTSIASCTALTVPSGGTLTCAAGSTATLAGTNTLSGSTSIASATAITVPSGGTLTCAAGSTVALSGSTTIAAPTITGNATAANITISGTLGVTGATTLSSTLSVTPSGTATAITGTGSGTGSGLSCTGGATNGPGAIATPGGTGIVSLRCSSGGVEWTGTQPTSTADPGQNMAYSTNQIKVWGVISTDGAGAISVVDGYNISSVSISGSGIRIFFARSFSSANYALVATDMRATIVDPPLLYASDQSLNVAGDARVFGFNAAGDEQNPATTVMRFAVQIIGRQ